MTDPAWIDTIPEDDAEDEVAAAYAYAGDSKTGNVDHIMKVHSLNPQSMLDHENLYKTLMYGKGPLKRPQREMIGVVVSALNHCVY
jgi:alkylhydroperoxidase family enzyme